MTDKEPQSEQLVLKDISDTSVLPVLTTGALAGCFLVNAVDISVPSPRLPKIVQDTWNWQGDDQKLTLNNLWVAVDSTWVGARKVSENIKMTEAVFDIFNLCGLCVVGERSGLKKSMTRAVKKKAYIKAEMLYHDGSGFEDGKHPAVLLIRRDRKTDKPILSVVGNSEESISFDFGAEEVESPLDNIIAFPPKK
jgi:hypothetical protein